MYEISVFIFMREMRASAPPPSRRAKFAHAAADLAQAQSEKRPYKLQRHGAVEGALAGKGSHVSRTRRGYGDLSGDCRSHAQGRTGRGRCCCLESCCGNSRAAQAKTQTQKQEAAQGCRLNRPLLHPSGTAAVDPAAPAAASQPAAPKSRSQSRTARLRRMRRSRARLTASEASAPQALEVRARVEARPARGDTAGCTYRAAAADSTRTAADFPGVRARVINDCFSRLSRLATHAQRRCSACLLASCLKMDEALVLLCRTALCGKPEPCMPRMSRHARTCHAGHAQLRASRHACHATHADMFRHAVRRKVSRQDDAEQEDANEKDVCSCMRIRGLAGSSWA